MIFNYSFAYKHFQNLRNNQPIAVIANFAKDGRFIPIYLRYISYDSSEYTYKVDEVKYIRDKNDCVLFCCLYTNEGLQYQIILTFYYSDCIWKLDVV